jgi:Caspase domain
LLSSPPNCALGLHVEIGRAVLLDTTRFLVACYWTVICLVLLPFGSLPAAAQTATHSQAKSVALVIGDAAYEKARRLDNPVNDATAVNTALRELGFDTILALDGDKAALTKSLDDFYAKIADAEVVMFYFAGHGVQINERNYLVPIDADPGAGASLSEQLQPLDEVLTEIETGRTPRPRRSSFSTPAGPIPSKDGPNAPGNASGAASPA